MGTKKNPGRFDCYANALPDEPMFILLGRDPDFHRLVMEWAERRERDINCGARPPEDYPMVVEARACATAAEKWRFSNNGSWRSDTRPVRNTGEA